MEIEAFIEGTGVNTRWIHNHLSELSIGTYKRYIQTGHQRSHRPGERVYLSSKRQSSVTYAMVE